MTSMLSNVLSWFYTNSTQEIGDTGAEITPSLRAMILRDPITNEITRLGARIPTRGTPKSIGLDLYTPAAFTIPANNKITVPLGIVIAIPEGYYGRIAPKSGVCHKTTTITSAGVIDEDYRKEVGLIMINYGNAPVTFEAGTSVCQLIMERADIIDVCEVQSLDEDTERKGGFGSTGAGIGSGSLDAAVREEVAKDAELLEEITKKCEENNKNGGRLMLPSEEYYNAKMARNNKPTL
jgi:dUTP pyrophosphatase